MQKIIARRTNKSGSAIRLRRYARNGKEGRALNQSKVDSGDCVRKNMTKLQKEHAVTVAEKAVLLLDRMVIRG